MTRRSFAHRTHLEGARGGPARNEGNRGCAEEVSVGRAVPSHHSIIGCLDVAERLESR